jgi:2-polyprenyl-3-methyl-5-hydroxy-6-metoxy-1,4-benzoquinol methylase
MDLAESTTLLPPEERRHPWETARLQILEELLRTATADGRLEKEVVVDIGCGDLFVAGHLARRWPASDFIGIDTAFDDQTLDSLRKSIGLPNLHIYSSMDDALEFLSGPATMILLNDVIEHVPDDVDFLRTIVSSGLVKAGTRVLITVPAFQFLWTRHDVFLGHYRRYTRRLLRRCVQAAGLTTATDGYFFLTLLPIRAVQAMLERAGVSAKEEKGIGQWGGGWAIAGLFREMLLLDFRVGRLLSKPGVALPGLSCYTICIAPQS